MKLPSPQILIAILLCTVSILVQGPFIRTLCLLVVAGMLLVALIRVALQRRPLPSQHYRGMIAPVIGVLGCVLVVAASAGLWIARPTLHLLYPTDQLNGASELVEYRGLYGVENDGKGNHFTWTQERATFVV